ncbi:hypothetical protein IJ818_01615 [bacterium]|nr:hypothetical protein [bacterium]
MTISVSSNLTLDNIIKVNQLPDSAVERIKQSLSYDDSDETSDENSDEELFVADYDDENANVAIADFIKSYTDSISNYLTYLSENKVSLGESPLKDLLKKKLNINISKSAYQDVGMGEYYNLKKVMKLSQSISNYNNVNNSSSTSTLKNLTNFLISV